MEYDVESSRLPIAWLGTESLEAVGIAFQVPPEDRNLKVNDLLAKVDAICVRAALAQDAAEKLKLLAGCDLLDRTFFQRSHPSNRQLYIAQYAERALHDGAFWESGVQWAHFFTGRPGQGPEFHGGMLDTLVNKGLAELKHGRYKGAPELQDIFRHYVNSYSAQHNETTA